MNITQTPLSGVLLVTLDVFTDERGTFVERFHKDKFAQFGLPTEFVQDNHSRSRPRVLRGMHYQFDKPQGKLVGVVSGRIWDVVVDLRRQSKTFGQSFGCELREDKPHLLWVPPGFAHGFCVLGDQPADVTYKCTAMYNKEGENGIRFDDPALAIKWPVESPIVSARDRALPEFSEYAKLPKF